jgi:hypothetical protein
MDKRRRQSLFERAAPELKPWRIRASQIHDGIELMDALNIQKASSVDAPRRLH